MTIYNQTMYGWDVVDEEVKTYANSAMQTYWHSNFAGTRRVQTYVSSGNLAKSSGTSKYDITNYVKNDGTYVLFEIHGGVYTASLIHGALKLYFDDDWSGTIQDAIDDEYVDPVAFYYSGENHSVYQGYKNLTGIFGGGNSDQQSYADAYYLIRPFANKTLTHFEFYTNKSMGSIDGLRVFQSNISKIGTSAAGVTPLQPYKYTYTAPTLRQLIKEYTYTAPTLRQLIKEYTYTAPTLRWISTSKPPSLYPSIWHPGGETRAPTIVKLPLPNALPSDFGIGLSAKMLHSSGIRNHVFWQAGGYTCGYGRATERISMTDGVVTVDVIAEWLPGDIVGVYAGRRDGELFLQAKVAGEMSGLVAAAGDALTGVGEVYVGCDAGGERQVNAVVADLVLHDAAAKIDPAGYLAKVPGGGE